MQEQLKERTTQAAPHSQTMRRDLSEEDVRLGQADRPWPVKALTWLLALESVLLGLTGFFHLQGSESVLDLLLEHPFFAAFIPLGLLALIATLGFLQLRPGAWVIAMLVQGLTLLTALVAYFGAGSRSPVLYIMMFCAVIMVLYLNYAEVPLVFRVQPGVVAESAGREVEGNDAP